MAALSDLVSVVSAVTGVPEATVFAYGRFARQAGLISQKGRGRSAAEMSLTDAANLLIAVAGTDVAKDAPRAIRNFRSLRNGKYYYWHPHLALDSMMALTRWLLNTVGIRPTDLGMGIPKDFGTFFEALLRSTLTGAMAEIFSGMPPVAVPEDLWSVWRREGNPNCEKSLEELAELGFAKATKAEDLAFGEDIQLEIKFSRLVPAVEIEFIRDWDVGPQLVHSITFGPARGAQARGTHHLRVEATITQHSLAAAALTLTNMFKVSAIKSMKPIEWLFWNHFKPEELWDSGAKAIQFALGEDFVPRRPYAKLK